MAGMNYFDSNRTNTVILQSSTARFSHKHYHFAMPVYFPNFVEEEALVVLQ